MNSRIEFKEGDLVWVKLQPYLQLTVEKRVSQKLAKRYFRPFCVINRVGVVAYKLALQEKCRVHLVFHVSLLKPYVGDAIEPIQQIPIDGDGLPSIVPLVICSYQTILLKGRSEAQMLVQWAGQPPEAATWEVLEDFRKSYPAFDLEDNVLAEGEGVDMSKNTGNI